MSDVAWIVVTFIACCFGLLALGLYLIHRDRA